MHKSDLIKEIAVQKGCSLKEAAEFLNCFITIASKTLKKSEKIILIGFGTFRVVKTAARKGRNPQTGKEITIKASKRVKFTPGKALKDSVK